MKTSSISMQSLEMGRKSCQLSPQLYEGDRCRGIFCRRSGAIRHLRIPSWVTRRCSRFCAGPAETSSIRLRRQDWTKRNDPELNTQGLLMEGLRLLDESSAARRRRGAASRGTVREAAVWPAICASPAPERARRNGSCAAKGRRGRCPPRRLNHQRANHYLAEQETLTAAVVTVSDSGRARGERQDASGPAVALKSTKHSISRWQPARSFPDDPIPIQKSADPPCWRLCRRCA